MILAAISLSHGSLLEPVLEEILRVARNLGGGGGRCHGRKKLPKSEMFLVCTESHECPRETLHYVHKGIFGARVMGHREMVVRSEMWLWHHLLSITSLRLHFPSSLLPLPIPIHQTWEREIGNFLKLHLYPILSQPFRQPQATLQN